LRQSMDSRRLEIAGYHQRAAASGTQVCGHAL